MFLMKLDAFLSLWVFFFFNDTATTEIYTLSLHDALPIFPDGTRVESTFYEDLEHARRHPEWGFSNHASSWRADVWKHFPLDRKSTRLNSSHSQISYAVFCLKKKNAPRIGLLSASMPSPCT